MAQIIIHAGRSNLRQQAAQPTAAAAQTTQATQPINIPQRDLSEYKTVVRPRFMGDQFVYIPERVLTRNPDGSPVRGLVEILSEWFFGKK